MPLPSDGNHLAQLARTFVTSELKLEGDIATHSFFVPLLFPFINHTLGDDLVFPALLYLHLFAKHQTGSQAPLRKVPGDLLFIIALLKAFERDEVYLISPDVQDLKTGVFRFIHSRSELINAIDTFANPECKSSLGTKLKSIFTFPSYTSPPPRPGSVHHSLSIPRKKGYPPPAYEAQNCLVAPQEPVEFSDVATLTSRDLRDMGGRHTVPALAYNEPWAPGMLELKAYDRGEVLDRMRYVFDGVVGEEPTEDFVRRFKEELMRKYRV
jgi:hypothetical protein